MSFEDLGLILRQERERRGMSIETAAARLKLMPRILRAIEQADIAELPQAAYARGFVKAYGNLLELDPELLRAGMADAWPDNVHQVPVPYDPAEEWKRSGKGRVAAFITLALILAAAGGFWFSRDLVLRLPSGILLKAEPAIPAKNEAPPPLIQAQSALAPGSGGQAAAKQTHTPQRISPSPATTPPDALLEKPASSAVPASSRQTEKLPDARPQEEPSAAGSSAVTQDDQHNLIIIALAECWVHSNADNTDTRQFSLRKGDTFALTFSKKLVLKLGNAGGVRLRLDGRDLGPPGEAGQVKTLTFP